MNRLKAEIIFLPLPLLLFVLLTSLSSVAQSDIEQIRIYAIPFHLRFNYGVQQDDIKKRKFLETRINEAVNFDDIYANLGELKLTSKMYKGEVRALYLIKLSKGKTVRLFVTIDMQLIDNKGMIYQKNQTLISELISLLPNNYTQSIPTNQSN